MFRNILKHAANSRVESSCLDVARSFEIRQGVLNHERQIGFRHHLGLLVVLGLVIELLRLHRKGGRDGSDGRSW